MIRAAHFVGAYLDKGGILVKNIIFLITDTFRYDNLGERAVRPVRTPELDRFGAERATSVEWFYTGSFPTIPHRTDLASGVLGWPHYRWQPIDQSGPNHVAMMLNAQGYATQLICDCPHLFNARFQQGFEAAFQHRGQEGDKPLLHLNDPLIETQPRETTRLNPRFRGHPLVDTHRWTNRYMRYETDMFPAKTAGSAVRFLEENYQAGPFFLWVDLFDPHEPWDPPEYLVARYHPDYDGASMMHPNYGPASAYTPEQLRNLWAHYAAEAELVDRYIGRILQKIDDLRLWQDSIVIVTSDHGTSLGEHDRIGKSNINDADHRFWPIYPEVGHVPFLIAGGDVPQGQSLDLIGQPIDILPTVAELAGVDVASPAPLDGRSFAPQVRSGATEHRDYAISSTYNQLQNGDLAPNDVTPFVTTQKWGWTPVGPDGQAELYDLAKDPLATNNVIADHPNVAAELRELLLDHLRQHHAPQPFLDLWAKAGL